MIKYESSLVTFTEVPDEISLCFNITGCPCHCEGCSEPELANDDGEELNEKVLDNLIKQHVNNITMVSFMGGDISHSELSNLARHIKTRFNLKVGMYSGRDWFDVELLNVLDAYKIGRYIQPTYEEDEWKKHKFGPLPFPTSNQLYFVKTYLPNGRCVWKNETDRFRIKPIGDVKNYII